MFCGRNSVAECRLPKPDVGGSNPLARFLFQAPAAFRTCGLTEDEKWAALLWVKEMETSNTSRICNYTFLIPVKAVASLG